MKKIISKILSYVLVAVIASGTTVACFFFAQKNNSTKLKEVENIISQYFIGDVDMGKLEDAAASAMVSALGDRWSYYMTAEQYQSYQQTMSNSYVGIGITILVRQDGTGFDITEVVDGGPAQQAGVLAGDILTAVDGTNVAGMDTASLSPLVRGEENTNVKLTILRNGETKEFTITRKKFQTPVATYQMLPDNIGLITIENFDQRCADETIAAIEALTAQGAEALIFDVRNNPGGFKTEMLKVLDYLLPEGPLFRAVDYRGKETVDYSDAKHLEIPMAVVMNLSSYSAAEFFAAALDEYLWKGPFPKCHPSQRWLRHQPVRRKIHHSEGRELDRCGSAARGRSDGGRNHRRQNSGRNPGTGGGSPDSRSDKCTEKLIFPLTNVQKWAIIGKAM